MFCCQGFENLISSAGERGPAIIARLRLNDKVCFLFQSRGIAFEDEAKIKPEPGTVDLTINIASEIGIRYCPFCGQVLEELTNKHCTFFVDLANKHQKYLTLMRKF